MGRKKINELGNKYDTMVVIREVPKEERPNKKLMYWELQCELCGKKRIIQSGNLRSQKIKCKCQHQRKNTARMEDLTGQTFGRLTVIRMATIEERGDYPKGKCWCKCSCGNPELKLVTSDKLKGGNTKSCGCLRREKLKRVAHNNTIDLTGQRFGRLVVKRLATNEEKIQNNKKRPNAYWWCDCDCGIKNVLMNSRDLKSGNAKSCGCLHSYGEELIGQILTNNNINFQKEYSFDDLLGDYQPLRFDFGIFNNEKLIGLIECDGEFHRRQTKINNFERQQRYDKLKNDYCREHNIPLLRIKYNVAEDIKEEEILDFIKEL